MASISKKLRVRREAAWRRPATRVRRASTVRKAACDVVGGQPRFLAVDFFCGAGGTTRGLIDAGGYVVAGIDKELRCERTYVENNPNKHGDCEPPLLIARDVFPKTDTYATGEQAELAAELAKAIAAGTVACYVLNAKNAYGAYTGYTPYAVIITDTEEVYVWEGMPPAENGALYRSYGQQIIDNHCS